MKRFLIILIFFICCFSCTRTATQYDKKLAIMNTFKENVYICELPYDSEFLVKDQDGEIWLISVNSEKNYKPKDSLPSILNKTRVIFRSEY